MSTVTQSKNVANYRFGQRFRSRDIKFSVRRQGYANRLVIGVVDDAIGKGFNIKNKKTSELITKNDKAMKIIRTMWMDLKKSCYYEREYGKSLGMFYLKDGEEVPFWRAYSTTKYFAKYDDFGIPFYYHVTNEVGGAQATANTKEVIDDEIDFTYEIIIRESDIKGEGLSVLEPVWDTLYGLSTLDENGVYFAIKHGAGIRYLKVPEAKFKDKVYMGNLMKAMKGSIGVNGMMALPYGSTPAGSGIKEEIEVISEAGSQINFEQLKKLLLGTLSAMTGIPIEIWEGSQLGLRSSEKNEDRYFDFLQSIQDGYRQFFEWIVYKLNEKFKWFGKDVIIEIDYIGRDTLSNDEKLAEGMMKLDIATKAGYNMPKAWLDALLGVILEKKEVDPLGINTEVNKEGEDNGDNDDKTKEEDSEEEDTEENKAPDSA